MTDFFSNFRNLAGNDAAIVLAVLIVLTVLTVLSLFAIIVIFLSSEAIGPGPFVFTVNWTSADSCLSSGEDGTMSPMSSTSRHGLARSLSTTTRVSAAVFCHI